MVAPGDVSPRERAWIVTGLIAAALIIALASYHADDHVGAFVNALGAVGQVGIAVAVFVINRAQWKLQERTAVQDRERHLKQVAHLKAEARDAIDSFYRSVRAEDWERFFEDMTSHLTDLKAEADRALRGQVVLFLRHSNRILFNTMNDKSDANRSLMVDWRDEANDLLRALGEEPLSFARTGRDG